MNKNGNVSTALCSCPKGIKCHHIAALLLFAHYNISVTDKQCMWRNAKTSKTEETMTCDDLYPKKPYCAIDRKITGEELEELRGQLNTFGATVGFSWLLREDFEENPSLPLTHIADVVFSDEFFSAENKEEFLREKCAVNSGTILQVAQQTVGQSKNESWFLARKHRLTASKIYHGQ